MDTPHHIVLNVNDILSPSAARTTCMSPIAKHAYAVGSASPYEYRLTEVFEERNRAGLVRNGPVTARFGIEEAVGTKESLFNGLLAKPPAE